MSPASRTVREERPLPWCIDKLWISPRDYQSPSAPPDVIADSVWIEVTEPDVNQAPGYKPGFHRSYLSPSELEERLRKL